MTRSEKSILKQNTGLLLIVITLMLSNIQVLGLSSPVIPLNTFTTPQYTLSADSTLNVTELWLDVWDDTDMYNVGNYTQKISVDYPNRTWTLANMSPSLNLMAAWDWANQTLQNVTDDDLAFTQITSFQSLLAIKQGTGASPRPALVVSGKIDSSLSPGANDAGITTAAVLEIARVLNDFSFSFDIYYVLVNGAHNDPDNDLGSREFVAWLEENEIETIMLLSFDRLLYHRTDIVNANKFSLRVDPNLGTYQRTDWFPNLIVDISQKVGTGKAIQVIDLDLAERSCAYEMWQVGRSAVHISQGYYLDSFSNTANDEWDFVDYNFAKATEAIATTAGAIAFIGLLGNGNPPAQYSKASLNPAGSHSRNIIVNYAGYINTTITWDGNTTLKASMTYNPSSTLVYQRTEDDGYINMKFLASEFGPYTFSVSNVGPNATLIHLNVTYLSDCDGDSLEDALELEIGTNMYLVDSDKDGLSDDFEVDYGTDPTNVDSDSDGASDFDEYTWGSSLLLNDTDSDGIIDGIEATLGTDPTSVDSDLDGIGDYDEVYVYLTDPTSIDTDMDGLEDGFEIQSGLNPLSPDSDSDSLSDLFEVLNLLNPLSRDTDGDGWTDAYEVEYCMSPTNPDTDFDGIPDGIDWDPQEHWISMVAPVTLLTIILLIMIFSSMKLSIYKKE